MNNLKIGDTIKCHDNDECVQLMDELNKEGVVTDFLYQKDDELGLWLVVTGFNKPKVNWSDHYMQRFMERS